MKFNYKLKFSKIVGVLLLINSLSANEIHLTGSITKIFNDGVREPFRNQKIYIKNKLINTKSWNTGNFDLSFSSSFGGEEIQLKIIDNDWFMISPFNGNIYLPKKSKDIKILMIRKDSSEYLTLFSEISHYTIQLLSIYDEKKAIDMVRRLRKKCLSQKLPKRLKNKCWKQKDKNKKKEYEKQKECIDLVKRKYCVDNIYHQSILRDNIPNNGYIYKVHFGNYKNKKNAEKDKKVIKGLERGWIKTHTKIKDDK